MIEEIEHDKVITSVQRRRWPGGRGDGSRRTVPVRLFRGSYNQRQRSPGSQRRVVVFGMVGEDFHAGVDYRSRYVHPADVGLADLVYGLRYLAPRRPQKIRAGDGLRIFEAPAADENDRGHQRR